MKILNDEHKIFSNFLNPPSLNSNCSNLLYLRNLREQFKKEFCYQKLFWPFTVRTNSSGDLNIFANSRPSASNFIFFSRSLEQFFLTVGQNNFGNKIPYEKIDITNRVPRIFSLFLCWVHLMYTSKCICRYKYTGILN